MIIVLAKEYAAWLVTASFDDMSLDKIGVWFEVIEAGRSYWESRQNGGSWTQHGNWQVYFRPQSMKS